VKATFFSGPATPFHARGRFPFSRESHAGAFGVRFWWLVRADWRGSGYWRLERAERSGSAVAVFFSLVDETPVVLSLTLERPLQGAACRCADTNRGPRRSGDNGKPRGRMP